MSPSGLAVIYQLPASDRPGFRHSVTHEDLGAIAVIAAWIEGKERQRAPAVGALQAGEGSLSCSRPVLKADRSFASDVLHHARLGRARVHSRQGKPEFAWIAAIPTVLFFILDAYYLALETRARDEFDRFVDLLHTGQLTHRDIYAAGAT